jgi:putative flavoprotein involved in K+ transport
MLDMTPEARAAHVLSSLGAALERGDIAAATACFQDDCYWRDLVTFTWNIHTSEGKDQIAAMLGAQLAATKPSAGDRRRRDGHRGRRRHHRLDHFETAVARGYGLIRLKDGKIWTLLTTMVELKGHEEPKGFRRPLGAKHGADKHRPTWKEEREAEARELGYTKQPYVVIIGGGQGGIALGARLRQLGVPTIIIEKNEKPGDSWRNRYKSLCLHDPVWYDHLPYIKFPPNWPVFAPKDKIGDWLEMYTKVMELNYWSKTTCKSAKYDEKTGEWTVVVDRDGQEVTLRPSSWCWPPACRARRTCRSTRAWRRSRATSTIRRNTPARMPTRARRRW